MDIGNFKMTKQKKEEEKNPDEAVWKRLLKVIGAENLDQAANKLRINPSTLRGRKARNAIPYEEIIDCLDAGQIAYVFKNEKVRVLEDANLQDKNLPATKSIVTNSSDSLHPDPLIAEYEDLLTSLMQRIETASLSKRAKIRIVDSLIRIVERDIEKIDRDTN